MRVEYHIGSKNEFSLCFVSDSFSRIADWQGDQSEYRLRAITAPDGDTLYLCYTNQPTKNSVFSDITDWSAGTATIAYAYLSAFQGVASKTDIQQNKSFNAERVKNAIERTQWKQSVTSVASDLWSNLVLSHPLPNTNHRSALALLSLYLQSNERETCLGTHLLQTAGVPELTDAFFIDSKRILTVRRNTTLFQILSEHGITEIERKGSVTIRLDEYNLTRPNPYEHYAKMHQQRTEEFVQQYLSHIGHQELLEREDAGKHAFVQWLRS